jgi:hypothetical protein
MELNNRSCHLVHSPRRAGLSANLVATPSTPPVSGVVTEAGSPVKSPLETPKSVTLRATVNSRVFFSKSAEFRSPLLRRNLAGNSVEGSVPAEVGLRRVRAVLRRGREARCPAQACDTSDGTGETMADDGGTGTVDEEGPGYDEEAPVFDFAPIISAQLPDAGAR